MTEKEFKIENDREIHSLTKIAHMAASVTDNKAIHSAGAKYVKDFSGISVDFIETLIASGVNMDSA